MTNTRKKEVLDKLWYPSDAFSYPSSGTRNLKFQHKWIHKWKWLSYSKKDDGAYCKYCVLFHTSVSVGLGKHENLGQLSITPFNNWKKATERFSEHQQRSYHKENVEKADIICKIATGGGFMSLI